MTVAAGGGPVPIRLDLNTLPELNLDALHRAWAGSSAEALAAYPDPQATGLLEALARKLRIPTESILAGNGSDEILGLAVRSLVPSGGAVATLDPTFAMYARFVAAHGGRILPVQETGIFPQEPLLRSGAGMFLIASPNNPTGTAYPERSLQEFAEATPHPIVLDEAYHQFAGQDLLPLTRSRSNVLVVRTFSKAYGLPGIRVGYGVGDPNLIRRLREAQPPFSVSSFSLRAALAALEDDSFVARAVATVRTLRADLERGLKGLGWEVRPSQANFLLAGPRVDASRTAERLRDRGIWVRAIDFPGGAAGSCLRITVGTAEQNRLCLDALSELGP
ncbi:MAG: pyridoxal phosphate-dependent aminotransferase [Thermoplasmata archaeon]